MSALTLRDRVLRFLDWQEDPADPARVITLNEVDRVARALDVSAAEVVDAVMRGKPATSPGLPRACPAWCTHNHQLTLDDRACTLEEAREHIGHDYVGQSHNEAGVELMRWSLELRARPRGPMTGTPYGWDSHVVVQLDDGVGVDGTGWRLTTGSARVLARQLLHLADTADLE